ncbi:MAG: ferritin-like domain-containing protein [Bacteroidota bacterium]
MKTDFNPWVRYYTLNQTQLLAIDWEDPYALNPLERRRITASLQQFQRGEHSEGKYLLHQARTYFKDGDDGGYVEALKGLIREEQRHAMTLGRFMKQQDIPRLRQHWVDDVFRFLRRMSGLPVSINILTVAEVIAAVYYQGLKYATESRVLQQLCNQILWDEAQHLAFQVCTLQHFYEKMPGWKARLHRAGQKFLLAGTIPLVWWQHRSVLKCGGFTLRSFGQACWKTYREIWHFSPADIKQEIGDWWLEHSV